MKNADNAYADFRRLLGEDVETPNITQPNIPPKNGLNENTENAGEGSARFSSIQEAVDAALEEVTEAYSTDSILIGETYTEEDVKALEAALTEQIQAVVDNKGTIDEGFRKIMSLVGGKLKMVKQKLASRAERLKARVKRKLNKSAIRKSAKKYMRSAMGRKHKMRRAMAMKKFAKQHPGRANESTSASTLIALCESKVVAPAAISDLHRALLEGYAMIEEVAGQLHDFFEEFGHQEHLEYIQVTESLANAASARCGLMESGSTAPDVVGFVNHLKAVHKLLEVFDTYVPLLVYEAKN